MLIKILVYRGVYIPLLKLYLLIVLTSRCIRNFIGDDVIRTLRKLFLKLGPLSNIGSEIFEVENKCRLVE